MKNNFHFNVNWKINYQHLLSTNSFEILRPNIFYNIFISGFQV